MNFEQTFIIGQQRSGTNLLRLILNNSSSLTAPHPPHVYSHFNPILKSYGDLRDDQAFFTLVKDVCKLVDLNPISWGNGPQDAHFIYEKTRTRDLIGVHESLMNKCAIDQEVSHWICKSKNNVDWADNILNHYSSPKFIYLVRDPRDVTLSFQRTLIGDKHAYFLASQWALIQQKCLELKEKLGDKLVFQIKYEDLIHNSKQVISDLCGFLEIPFEDKMLNYHKSQDAQTAASASQQWKNVVSPILKTNSGKFENAMSMTEIRIIESLCLPEMITLGYSPVSPIQVLRKVHFSSSQIDSFAISNSKRKAVMYDNFDHNDIQSRLAQDSWINEIIARNEKLV